MLMKQYSLLLKLRSVYRQTRFKAKLPDPPCESADARSQHSRISCARPQNEFPYQLPYEKLMAEYRELEAKSNVLRTALHQTSNNWQTQRPSPRPPNPEKCRYHLWTTVECPPGKLRLKKTCCLHRMPRKESHHLYRVFLSKVLSNELRQGNCGLDRTGFCFPEPTNGTFPNSVRCGPQKTESLQSRSLLKK